MLTNLRWRPVLVAYGLLLAVLCVGWVPRQVPTSSTLWQGAGYAPLWRLQTAPKEFSDYSESRRLRRLERIPLDEIESAPSDSLAEEFEKFRQVPPPGYIDPGRYRFARIDKEKLGLEILALTGLASALLLLLPMRKN